MSWVLLAWLTISAFVAAVAVALRLRPAGRAELFLATGVLWNVLLVAPTYALGYAHALTPRALALTAALTFHATFWLALPRGRRARGALEALGTGVELLALPFEALGVAVRERSLVAVPLALCGWLVVHTAIGSYYTPSWRQWDSLWYHETIVGYTIQEHAIGVLDLPGDLQKVNGYPRLCEMTHLWFVIFTDRRLIELTNSLIAPFYMAAAFLLARRFSKDTLASLGLAAALMLMPTAAYLLESTYIDVQVALFVLAATYYGTRPELRYVDVAMAVVSLVLMTESKFLVVPNVAVLSFIVLFRLFAQRGFGWRTWAVAAAGALSIVLAACSIYLRNYLVYENPFWPDVNLDVPKLGIHFVGNDPGTNLLDMNLPPRQLVEEMLAVPYVNRALGPKEQLYDYGFPIIWVLIPLGFFGLWIAGLGTLRSLLGRLIRRASWVSAESENAVLVALPAIAGAWVSPALWSARYHIAHVAVLAALVAYVGGAAGWRALVRDAAVACAVASVIAFFWVTPRWWYTPSELYKLARIPFPEREVTPASAISPGLWVAAGSAMTREVGLARAKTIGPGALVAYNDREQFVAMLWNDQFTNRVQYIQDGPDYVDRVMASGAIWVYCRHGDPSCAEFRRRGWKDVGTYNVQDWGVILRRADW